MPTLAALTINSDDIDIQELYDESISDPTDAAPATLEMLNGGLDTSNFAGNVPPWAVQPGSFVRGIHIPFNQWEIIYAKQMSTGTTSGSDDTNVISAMLSTRLFIPWEADVVFGWQAFFRHDASLSYENDAPASTEVETWEAKFYAAGSQITQLKLTLHPTRFRSDLVAPGTHDWSDIETPDEDRWMFNSNAAVISSQDKGYLSLVVRITATIYGDDPKIAKLIIPEGAVWCLAIRRS